jgi:hypothetical protein
VRNGQVITLVLGSCLELGLQVFFHSAGDEPVHAVVRVGKHDGLADVVCIVKMNLCAVDTVAVWLLSAFDIFRKEIFIDFSLFSLGPCPLVDHLGIGHGLTQETEGCLRPEIVRFVHSLTLARVVAHAELAGSRQVVALGP